MKIVGPLFASLFLLALACSSKSSQVRSGSSPIVGNAVVGNAVSASNRFYYADLQILTETTPEGDCSDENRLRVDLSQEPKVTLDETKGLELAKNQDFKYFAAHVNLEAIGFDSSKYSFSVLDGIEPKIAPFKLHLRRTPGQVLEIHFLDQVVPMKLMSTPVYTFSATEKRGPCTIKHNVNVFAERVGYFKKIPFGN